MSESARSPEHPPHDLPAELPGVEPPSAGFIVQLFLIPGLVVGIIVLVYLLFGKIAGSRRSPEEYLADLRSPNEERRWCAARELASILPHDAKWQADESFAAALAGELESRLSTRASGEMDRQFQKYLAMALGEFQSSVGISTLCRVIQDEQERDLRVAGILSLGHLGDRLGGLPDTASLPALLAASRDADTFIRKLTAFALGSTGRSEAVETLMPMLNDSDSEVRYNAANALARLGSTAGLDTMQEMLDIEHLRMRGLSEEQLGNVPLSALRALERLLATVPQADLSALRPSITSLTRTGTTLVRTSAKNLLIELGNRSQQRAEGTRTTAEPHQDSPRGQE